MTLGAYEYTQCRNCHRPSHGEQYCQRCEAIAEQEPTEPDAELDEEERLAVLDSLPVNVPGAGVKTAISYLAPAVDQKRDCP